MSVSSTASALVLPMQYSSALSFLQFFMHRCKHSIILYAFILHCFNSFVAQLHITSTSLYMLAQCLRRCSSVRLRFCALETSRLCALRSSCCPSLGDWTNPYQGSVSFLSLCTFAFPFSRHNIALRLYASDSL